jgi:hypothetical protein
MQWLYLILAILGTVLPFRSFFPSSPNTALIFRCYFDSFSKTMSRLSSDST